MQRRFVPLFFCESWLFIAGVAIPSANHLNSNKMILEDASLHLKLRAARSSPLDLEIAGDLAGLAAGKTGYLTREDLLGLPQVSFTVRDDANFGVPVQIRGIDLEILRRGLTGDGEKTMVVAVCGDLYRAHYPQAYLQAHKPVLVLEVNGQGPPGWPKSKEGTNSSMGPYLVSNPDFVPSFRILSHSDEPQIPWGVIRLEFRNEQILYGTIAPHGVNARDQQVQAGYHIAQQNCFRCHAPAREGRQKGMLSWEGIGLFADSSPHEFAAYVRNPQGVVKDAKMPANPTYDDATLQALTMYFRTFTAQEKR